MARNQDDKRPKRRDDGTAEDPRWDRKHGTAKDDRMARQLEESSDRYTASEQSEQKRSTKKE